MDSDEDDVGVDFQFAKGVELTSNECLRIFLSGKGSDKDLGVDTQQCAANAAEIAAKTLQALKIPEECYGTTGAFSKIQARSSVKSPPTAPAEPSEPRVAPEAAQNPESITRG